MVDHTGGPRLLPADRIDRAISYAPEFTEPPWSVAHRNGPTKSVLSFKMATSPSAAAPDYLPGPPIFAPGRIGRFANHLNHGLKSRGYPHSLSR